MKRHLFACTALALLLVAGTGSAKTVTSCVKDRSGKVTCHKTTTTHGNVDHSSNANLRHPDAGSDGNVRVDQYGHATRHNSDGTTTRAQTDQYGNTTFRNSTGGTTRCTTDSTGKTSCRPH
jgi:hypothetical protein